MIYNRRLIKGQFKLIGLFILLIFICIIKGAICLKRRMTIILQKLRNLYK